MKRVLTAIVAVFILCSSLSMPVPPSDFFGQQGHALSGQD